MRAPVAELPVPVIEGARARYLDIWPGIDLVVDVMPTGFEQYYVVHSRDALAALGDALPLEFNVVNGSSRLENGEVVIADAAGIEVARLPQPFGWDAVNDTYRASPVLTQWVDEVDESRGEVPLPNEVLIDSSARVHDAGFGVMLAPAEEWLNGPDTVFPIVIDPVLYNPQVGFDTTTTTGSYANTARYSMTEILMGKDPSYARSSRGYFAFDISGMRNLDLTGAGFVLFNYWSATCSQVHWHAYWTNPPSTSNDRQQPASVARWRCDVHGHQGTHFRYHSTLRPRLGRH
jgi:hypothetical protein